MLASRHGAILSYASTHSMRRAATQRAAATQRVAATRLQLQQWSGACVTSALPL